MPADLPAYCFAAIVAAGGVMGYARAGSLMSLVAGLGFGAALGVGAQQVSDDPSNLHLSLAVSAILLAVMGARFRRSGKMMPAGLVTAISLLFVVRYGCRALTGSRW
ncbi:transmembrane protein 14C-like [Pollicipes pollicipes]|uniref:transmembrane protein 14C-like n=1 Tax=Pollicipes pollicipes TaxID=41117 RepID=UPI001884F730|nr:transmembrane protein 14C-like [Pollicipes pollicipes]XP_037069192.1 transmembrane protein 14C-like [Pollicipes pollicipes]XP_037069193.1 transmembrane protein 14C-like [Pollicipes pollicipes]XP_037069194.1 transmembrane protein 14C-like [Pollicipes pollicipes]